MRSAIMDGMKHRISDFFDRVRKRARTRRQRAVERAAREMMRGDDTHGGSIWRSGKGGSHPG